MPPPPPCKHFNSRRMDGTLSSALPVQKMFHVKHFPVRPKTPERGEKKKPRKPTRRRLMPDACSLMPQKCST